MRKVLPVLLTLSVAACATPMRWEKPGATDASTAADMTDCRRAAQHEAMRYYPYGYGYGYYPGGLGWGFHRRSAFYWQMRQDNDRFYAENRLTAFCMRTRGYEQIEVRPAPQPQAPPPAPPPASPEPPLK